MSVVRTEIVVRLRVYDNETGDSVLLPVSEAAISFAVNSVPVCGVQIGLGVDLGSPTLKTPVDADVRLLLRKYQTCQLLGIFTGEAVQDSKWPEEAQLLFEGRISSVQDAITANGAALKVNINHWLADLASGSMLAFHTNTLMPDSRRNPAATYTTMDAGAKRKPAGIGGLADANTLNSTGIGEDLWAKGIKRLYAAILVNPGPAQFDDSTCGDDLTLPPAELKAAFRRIEGDSEQLGSPYSRWAKPLRFLPNANEGDDSERLEVAKAISEQISQNPISSVSGTDAWTLLQRYIFPSLGLMLVPRISSAIVAPSTPTLTEPYCQRIISNDIISVDCNRMVLKPTRGIGIVGRPRSTTGAVNGKARPLPVCYFPPVIIPGGKMFYLEPPAWLAGLQLSGATVASIMRQKIAMNGVIEKLTTSEEDEEREERKRERASASLLAEYARMVFVNTQAQGNTAIVAGRLRFDIAPGSIIEVAAKTEQIAGLGVNTPQMQGFVSHVTIMLSASKQKAFTQFQLQHVRSLSEVGLEEYSLDRHPLYFENFTGCPLSDSLAVPACP